MSWRKELDVPGGQVRFEASAQEDMYTVMGLLECGQQFLVGFQRTGHRIQLARSEMPHTFDVLRGTIELQPRQLKFSAGNPQPSTFLKLAQELLKPRSREPYGGYELLVSVKVEGWEPGAITLDDSAHPHSFVEFAHLEHEPYCVVSRTRPRSYPGPEELEREFRALWQSILGNP
jgi:hypothetical protein